MAGAGKLSVEIGADKSDFDKKIKEIEYDIKELSKVKLERLKLGLDTNEINAQIKDAKNSLNSLKTTVKDTGQSFVGLKPQVANGGNALMQFSRIAQDAPFGIMGIGNNITATTEAFAALKNQTGSTSGALKAIGQSILGSGGVLLGVSLLTTGLTYLAQSGLSVGDVIDKLTGNFDEFANSVEKARLEAAKNSGQEIANIKALVLVAQDEVKTRKERLIAVQELQDKYPAYFGNLDKEKILNGDLTSVTKELTKAIIARAEATALSDRIGQLASKRLDLEIQKEKAILKLKEAQSATQNQVTVTGGTLGATGLSAQGQLASAVSRVKDINTQIAEIQREQNKLVDLYNQKTSQSISLLEKKQKASKPVIDTPQVTGVGNPFKPASLVDLNQVAVFNGKIDEFGNKIKALPGIMSTSLPQVQNTLSLATAQMILIMQDFNASLNDLIQNSLPNAIADLGNALGNALATGKDVVSALGESLLRSLGSFISQLGQMLIQYGLLLVGFGKAQLAFQVGDPITKIGAGAAMIALGIAATALGGAIGSFASGNGRGGGMQTSTGAGANNNNFTSSSFSNAQGGGTVVFEIAGQKLIGVLNNTLNANRRLGGAIGLG